MLWTYGCIIHLSILNGKFSHFQSNNQHFNSFERANVININHSRIQSGKCFGKTNNKNNHFNFSSDFQILFVGKISNRKTFKVFQDIELRESNQSWTKKIIQKVFRFRFTHDENDFSMQQNIWLKLDSQLLSSLNRVSKSKMFFFLFFRLFIAALL